jgi:putative hydrolase of the HAD superfamily
MDHIKAVIFDLDNTLLDRTRTFRLFAEAFVDRFLGETKKREALIGRIELLDEDGYKDKPTLFRELLDELPWLEKPLHEDLLGYYEKEYVNSAILMDQAEDLIHYLGGKYKLGLITNGRTAIQYGKIDRLAIRDRFEVILVSEEAGIKKPDSRIFRTAIERLNVLPEECVYVGDHPVNDVEGAASVGMRTVWLEVNQPWRESVQAIPWLRIVRLGELKKYL